MTRICIDKINNKIKYDSLGIIEKPGLVDLHLIDSEYPISMTAEYTEPIDKNTKQLDVNFILYGTTSNDIYKDEKEYLKSDDNGLAVESFFPLGSLSQDKESPNKNSHNLVVGKVLKVKEVDGFYFVDIKCLGITFYAEFRKDIINKPEVGNIISGIYFTEIEPIVQTYN